MLEVLLQKQHSLWQQLVQPDAAVLGKTFEHQVTLITEQQELADLEQHISEEQQQSQQQQQQQQVGAEPPAKRIKLSASMAAAAATDSGSEQTTGSAAAAAASTDEQQPPALPAAAAAAACSPGFYTPRGGIRPRSAIADRPFATPGGHENLGFIGSEQQNSKRQQLLALRPWRMQHPSSIRVATAGATKQQQSQGANQTAGQAVSANNIQQ